MMKMQTSPILKTYFPSYMTEGAIFSKMTTAPWIDVTSGLDMDILYIGSWSGNKLSTSFVEEFVEGGVLNTVKLANVLLSMYGENWKRLWEDYNASYNPLNNYDMVEDITRNRKNDRSIDRSIDRTETVDATESGSSDTKSNGDSKVGVITSESGSSNGTSKTDNTTTTDTTENEVTTTNYGRTDKVETETDSFTYGFNSPEAVPTAKATSTEDTTQGGSDSVTRDLTLKTVVAGESATETTGASTTNGTSTTDTTYNDMGTVATSVKSDTTSTDKTTDTTGDTQEEDETIRTLRTGNIGVTSSQDLLLKEFELWKWNFYEHVFNDCDRFLVLSIYDTCQV